MKGFLHIASASIVLLASAGAHAAAPARVVSLKPSITDTVYALGLGERLVGVTRYCQVPAGARRPEVVADYTRPYSERIIALRPDIVLGSRENSSRRSIEALSRAGLRVELFPFTTIEETESSIRGIAAALGKPARGDELARRLHSDLSSLAKRYGGGEKKKAVVIWGLRPMIAAGPGTYMSDLMGIVGLENIMQGTSVKYPHIGLEKLIAEDPDFIIDLSMDSGGDQGRAERPWGAAPSLRALRNGGVITMGPSEFRAGPGIAKALERLAAAVHGH
jgi:iron complex transport system substrate-binding protein